MNVTYFGGYSTIYTGVFNQDTFVFSGSYEDDTGFIFNEVYKMNKSLICTNYEVHGGQCELGCAQGKSCDGHSCSCGASYGVFEYLPTAESAGACGPAGAGSLYSSYVQATDDDYERSQTVDFCFVGNVPLSISKHYTSNSASNGVVPGVDLAARFLAKAQRPLHANIQTVQIQFNTWFPMQADPKAFVQPDNCSC